MMTPATKPEGAASEFLRAVPIVLGLMATTAVGFAARSDPLELECL